MSLIQTQVDQSGHRLLGSSLRFPSWWELLLWCGAVTLAVVAIPISLQADELGYEALPLLPTGFLILLFGVYRGRVRHERPVFFMVLIAIAFLRYVLLPILIVYSGHYGGRSFLPPEPESYSKAIFLMFYEAVVITLAVYFCERLRGKTRRASDFTLVTFPAWLTVALFFTALVLVAMTPEALLLINVVTPHILSADEFSATPMVMFSAQFFIIAKNLVALRLMISLARVYKRRGARLALFGGLLVTCVAPLIYFGTNRLSVLITACAFALVFLRGFGKPARSMLVVIVLLAATTILVISQERQHKFMGDTVVASIADTIQVYVGGVYNVAIGVEVPDYFPGSRSARGLAYDFLRPTLGINYIVKDWQARYSNEYYNFRIWTHVDRRSQIIPMIAQGYLYFGFIFAPALGLVFIATYYALERVYARVRSVELFFFISLVVIRLGFMWGQNTMNLMNFMSMNLVLFMFIYMAWRFLVRVGKAG